MTAWISTPGMTYWRYGMPGTLATLLNTYANSIMLVSGWTMDNSSNCRFR